MARTLARVFVAPLFVSTTSRLLIDLNRSIGHPRVFSEFTRHVPDALRKEIVARCYVPYRTEVERLVRQTVAKGRRVVHVSSHSFTPVLEGTMRYADVGLLYDPARSGEVALCARWKAALATAAPGLRVRRNYPYAGKGDGQTATLRRKYPPGAYVGIELEINQRIAFAGGAPWKALQRVLASTLHAALSDAADTGDF
jgi:predicted N-formylglutamate amidohydrolase